MYWPEWRFGDSITLIVDRLSVKMCTLVYSSIFCSKSETAIWIAVSSAAYTLWLFSVPMYSPLVVLSVGEYVAAPICPPWPEPSVYMIRSCGGICCGVVDGPLLLLFCLAV